ncbi:MAG: DNA replication/repair protein RecF [Chloroflexi bacterium]|nr:DNA replication/repair protein RecF [Chloroflexota bacterium]MCY3583262.1 DNA replication/repair protein RecF [Chloroflexota bacterium]MCY3717731.1 DNA replication/repair protein RecF [Chloroflexota bacterium]MDE2651777.1 DNA replication/repair protein RecF [Chloroflexota bacterium]MXV93404.1 DNA replication/repair protein RecF [Chloroflexota bacterium]
MRIEHLSLTNFRNYARLELSLPAQGPVLLYGENAQGKTSILEAITYLATSISPYTTSDRQLIHWRTAREPIPFARLSAQLAGGAYQKLDITLMMDLSTASPRFKKSVKLNGVEKRVMDVVGLLNVVLFLPQDLSLIEGAPSDRRRFMDTALRQIDREYRLALHDYEKVLPQRNALLKRIADGRAGAVELDYWDEQLAGYGAVIIAARQRFLRELEALARDNHHALSGGREMLSLRYLPSLLPAADGDGRQRAFSLPGLDLDRQLTAEQIQPQFCAQLLEQRNQAIARGMTVAGPHRDELRLLINERDCGDFGSRGQARTAVMALRFAELGWMRDQLGEYPLFLLDEVAAELDARRRRFLLDQLDGNAQTLLTSTDLDDFDAAFLARATIYQVVNGQVSQRRDNSDTNP